MARTRKLPSGWSAGRTHSASASGFTLIEAMIAMAVLLLGSVGMLALHAYGLQLNADARVITRATAVAQDLLAQMQTWDYLNDPRLANSNTENDDNWSDAAGRFQEGTPPGSGDYDHAEGELETTGGSWSGIPTAEVRSVGLTRYWNVAEPDLDANGAVMGRRVAVIVRWEQNRVARRLVLVAFIKDPQVTN